MSEQPRPPYGLPEMAPPPVDSEDAFNAALMDEFRTGPSRRYCPLTDEQIETLRGLGVLIRESDVPIPHTEVVSPFGRLIVRV